jgi:hypothetical protein
MHAGRMSLPAAYAVQMAKVDAARAIVWLQQAAAAGYKNAAHTKEYTDLDEQRERENLKKLQAKFVRPKRSDALRQNLVHLDR